MNKVFIATDHSELKQLLKEAKSRYGNKYEIYHGKKFVQGKIENIFYIGLFNRKFIWLDRSREALIETLAITRILANCQFVVCTLSSNVGIYNKF